MSPKDSTDSRENTSGVRKETKPDLPKPSPPEKLNKDLQRLLAEDSLFDEIYEGTAPDTTDSNLRYLGYSARIRTVLLGAHRYVAYTSDIGESFRPIAHPYLVKGAYAISWAYLTGDVLHEGYKAYWRNQRMLNSAITSPQQNGLTSKLLPTKANGAPSTESAIATRGRISAIEDYRTIMAERAIFQAIASMGLPAFTIHSIVRYSGRALKNARNTAIRTYAPIGLGLAAVPFLPYVFDEPVEKAVEWTFYNAFKTIGGPEAVGNRPKSGRGHQLEAEARLAYQKEKEKEL